MIGVDRIIWLLTISFFLLLLALEWILPLRERRRGRLERYGVNLLLSVLVFLVGSYGLRPLALRLALSNDAGRGGLLGLIPGAHPAVYFVLGFLLLDLTFYWWHRANHRIGLLWRFHVVHHIDPDMDVTTAFRFHYGEILLSVGFRVIQVGLLGVSPLVYAAYETVFTLETMFHHSNLRLPTGLERALNLVLVTPRMHGIHHSAVAAETNSNYSVVFRFWDSLHRSLRLNVPQKQITVGVPAYLDRKDNTLRSALLQPFARQRDYWLGADGIRRDSRPLDPAWPDPTRLAV